MRYEKIQEVLQRCVLQIGGSWFESRLGRVLQAITGFHKRCLFVEHEFVTDNFLSFFLLIFSEESIYSQLTIFINCFLYAYKPTNLFALFTNCNDSHPLPSEHPGSTARLVECRNNKFSLVIFRSKMSSTHELIS